MVHGDTRSSRWATRMVTRPPPKAVFLSSSLIGRRERYADVLRKQHICNILRDHGFVVSVAAPDGRLVSYTRQSFADHFVKESHADHAALNQLVLFGPITAALVLLRTLRLVRDRPSAARIMFIHNGGWMTFAAVLCAKLRQGARIHLDVMGFAQTEARLAGYRFWKLKAVLFEWMFRHAIATADVVTTINHAHADRIAAIYHRAATVLPDLLEPAKLSRLLALPTPAPRPTVTLIFVGSVSRNRLDTLFEAAMQLHKTFPEFRVVIVGSGDGLEEYKRKYEADGIIFAGFADEVALEKLLASADLAYSDVWSEIGTPFKLVEYMAAGRAIVTFKTPSTAELISDGREGILCSEGAQSLESAIRRLLLDVSLRQSLGLMARARAIELHKSNPAKMLLELYRQELT